jgi:hypothetical protein
MTYGTRLIFQLVVTAVLAAVVSFSIPVFVDRHEYASAVSNETSSPNPDNEATLTAERAKNERFALTTHMGVTVALFLLMNAGWLIAKRRSGKSPRRA